MTKKYNMIYPVEQEAIGGIVKHPDPNFLVRNHSNKFDCKIMTLGYPKSDNNERILKLEYKGIEIRAGNPEWAQNLENYIL